MVGVHSLCTGEAVSGGGGDTGGRKGIRDYDSRLRLFMPATLTHSTPITEIRHAAPVWGRREVFFFFFYWTTRQNRCPALQHVHKHRGAEPLRHPRQAKLWLRLPGLQTCHRGKMWRGRRIDLERQEMNRRFSLFPEHYSSLLLFQPPSTTPCFILPSASAHSTYSTYLTR